MDILSDVNVVGKIYSSSLITGYICANSSCGNYTRIENGNISVSCLLSVSGTADVGGKIRFGNDSSIDETSMMLREPGGGNTDVHLNSSTNYNFSAMFCRQVWLYGGAYEETKPGEYPVKFSYYVRKINKTIQVPSNCSKFLIEENIPPHDGCSQSFPVIQSVGTFSKRSVSMDYEFCGNSTVYGIISTGGDRETEFAFQILVS